MGTPDILFFAQGQPPDVLNPAWHGISRSTRDLLLVLGAVAILVTAFVIWAIISRRKQQQVTGWNVSAHSSSSSSESSSEQGHRRRRKRRRPHRPRNPTLAETGGLPPLRRDRSSDNPV